MQINEHIYKYKIFTEIIEKRKYQRNSHFEFNIDEGNYIIKVFFRNKNNGEKVSKSIKISSRRTLQII